MRRMSVVSLEKFDILEIENRLLFHTSYFVLTRHMRAFKHFIGFSFKFFLDTKSKSIYEIVIYFTDIFGSSRVTNHKWRACLG